MILTTVTQLIVDARQAVLLLRARLAPCSNGSWASSFRNPASVVMYIPHNFGLRGFVCSMHDKLFLCLPLVMLVLRVHSVVSCVPCCHGNRMQGG